MNLPNTEKWNITDANFQPIIKEYAKRLQIVQTINQMTASRMDLPPGVAVLAMVHDTLSGRTPLFRLKDTMCNVDTELLFSEYFPPEMFNDNNLGRAMDAVFIANPVKVFSQISQNAIEGFEVKTVGCAYDATSISVYGDYDVDNPPLIITKGYSKDKRPDLKQFLISMLCVDRNIPIMGRTENGNESEKIINNQMLTRVSKDMASHGLEPGAFIYVADAAFATGDNIKKAAGESVNFLSRLPANFNEHERSVTEAVEADQWEDLGVLSPDSGSIKRPPAYYRARETSVTIEGVSLRAVVIHSSTFDKRRQKRVDRSLKKDKERLGKETKQLRKKVFQCEPDARSAAFELESSARSGYHRVEWQVTKTPKFQKGRPKKGEPRVPVRMEYNVDAIVREDLEKIEKLRLAAGCFVLITNVPEKMDDQKWDALELLTLYKGQDGIEKNFSFLKDPAIVNAIFLKKPERIQVLGMILLIALLIWRLIERDLRLHVKETGESLPGWRGRSTKTPTSFMMTTKFTSVLVIQYQGERQLAKPLTITMLKYLNALKLKPDIYLRY